jgi:hypothetical protein
MNNGKHTPPEWGCEGEFPGFIVEGSRSPKQTERRQGSDGKYWLEG